MGSCGPRAPPAWHNRVRCPSLPSACGSLSPNTAWTLNPNNLGNIRYQMPMTHVFPEGWVGAGRPVKTADFQAPAETVVVLESSNTWWTHYCPRHNVGGLNRADKLDAAASANGEVVFMNGSLNDRTWPWHSDGLNVAFCDGHVKWEKISTLADANRRYLWDRD